MEQDHERISDNFWKRIYVETGVSVPTHLRNILKLSHMDNPLALRRIDKSMLTSLQKFASEDMMNILEDEDNVNLKDYYYCYHKNPKKFKFVPGDEIVLLDLGEYIRGTEINYWGEKNDITLPEMVPETDPLPCAEVDTDHEKQNLERCIKDMFKRSSKVQPELFTKDLVRSFERGLSIEVSIGILKNGRQTYTADITCACGKKMQMSKILDQAKGKTRWVTSNLKEHILEKHFAITTDPPPLKKIKTLLEN